jgi:hypothetical protein
MSFEVSVPIETLQKRGLFLATPMYGGQCAGMFARSIADLSALCTHYRIPLQMYFLFNESLITRARNYCVDEFMRAGFDTEVDGKQVRMPIQHFMFIDSDIGFNPHDVLALMAMQSDESEYDVLCGPYPKKCISWEKIKVAVDKGFADENPNNLENFVGDYVFNPKSDTKEIALGSPAEVLEGGTGFMMIRRPTFDKFAEARPDLLYKPDHVRTENFDGSREIMAYFDCIIDPESKRYLSEDYKFCYDVQKIGMKVWLCPWMKLQHVGTYVFGGSLADLAQLGVAATADPAQLRKTK